MDIAKHISFDLQGRNIHIHLEGEDLDDHPQLVASINDNGSILISTALGLHDGIDIESMRYICSWLEELQKFTTKEHNNISNMVVSASDWIKDQAHKDL